jgi:dynein heavy chain
MFKTVNREKRSDLKWSINRLKSGLDKLVAANVAVAEMQILLTKMKPELEEAAIDTEKMMIRLEVDKKEADEVQKVVSVEEAIA